MVARGGLALARQPKRRAKRAIRGGCVGVLMAAAMLATPAAARHDSQVNGEWRGVRVVAPAAATAIRRALDEASQRLLAPRCQQLLDEFRDEADRPLSARLTTLGVDVRVYLSWIQFHDGAPEKCANGWTVMYTAPGSRVVGTCKVAIEHPPTTIDSLAVSVIHEMLHTLGLRENPPTSAEISERVRRLCWAR